MKERMEHILNIDMHTPSKNDRAKELVISAVERKMRQMNNRLDLKGEDRYDNYDCEENDRYDNCLESVVIHHDKLFNSK